jgi:hypothetical protein
MLQIIPKVAVSWWVGTEVAGAKIGPPDSVDNCTFALRRDVGEWTRVSYGGPPSEIKIKKVTLPH